MHKKIEPQKQMRPAWWMRRHLVVLRPVIKDQFFKLTHMCRAGAKLTCASQCVSGADVGTEASMRSSAKLDALALQ
jgi:hypothetical protein